MKRILLTGITGQLGEELQRTLVPFGEIIGVDRQSLDLSQTEQIRGVIAQIQPDLIINAAAYTAVDKAETETEAAMAINATAPTIMAQEAERIGATLIHVSTDYVFDGSKNIPYTESDHPNPINAYGKSKLLGEQGVQQNCDRHIILRTAWVYGVYGKGNFVKTMLRLGTQRQEVRVVVDQVGTPTWTGDLAGAIAKITQHNFPYGVYNCTNSGAISWYDFAVAIFEEAEKLGFPVQVQQVVPITTPEYPTPAPRPAYSVLSGKKISGVLGTHLPHWRQGLRQMLKQLYTQK